jgi:tetraacyldisaccharide 4'-kinase
MLAALKAIVIRSWQGRGVIARLLLPIAVAITPVVVMRRWLYRVGVLRSVRLPVPVVVVGNVTAGGSGKTPLVLWLARRFSDEGQRPGIISRGYGGRGHAPRRVDPNDDASEVGDEPLLLARRRLCPVWIGADRVAAARGLLAAHPDCGILIADDGLQHYRLGRDYEIVVIDELGLRNGWPLPAGPLREPVSRIAYSDALVLNGDVPERTVSMLPARQTFTMRLVGTSFHALGAPQRTAAASDFAGRRVHAVAAIGNPQRFFDHLSALGLSFVAHPFTDHHAYRARDLAFADCEVLLMTEKDAVKCEGLAPPETWVLRVDAQVSTELSDSIKEKLDGRQAA